MTELLDQPAEVLHTIFQFVDPWDLACVSKTCRYLNKLIQTDELLWKSHYLARFDPPEEESHGSWRQRLQRLVDVQKILESEDDHVKDAALEEVLTQSVRLARRTTPSHSKNAQFLARLYASGGNAEHFLGRSGLFAQARPERRWDGGDTAAPTEHLRQLSAELHVLGGMNLDATSADVEGGTCLNTMTTSAAAASRTTAFLPEQLVLPVRRHLHPYARSRVYDLRRYTAANMWGPFTDDGSARVDWEKVQAIMIDLAYNHRMYTARRGLGDGLLIGTTPSDNQLSSNGSSASSPASESASESASASASSSSSSRPTNNAGLVRPREEPFQGIAADSFVSYSLAGTLKSPEKPNLDALDPYGVGGTWMRIVCFLDYNDLYAFNFEPDGRAETPPHVDREPITTREAFRLIRLQLHVTAVEPPGEDDGQDLPVVHFEGLSRSTFMAWDPNANSRIRGTVRLTPSGAVRWTTFSIFHGEERWRSEGVQVGGLRSARGVLGNWFDKDYDAHGPAGPTAFWKVSDDIFEEKRPLAQMVQIYISEMTG